MRREKERHLLLDREKVRIYGEERNVFAGGASVEGGCLLMRRFDLILL